MAVEHLTRARMRVLEGEREEETTTALAEVG
jgi:hypothetical protein